MKIRQGFVSNSSSTSFVIAIDKESDGKIDIIKKTTLNFNNLTTSIIKDMEGLENFCEEMKDCWMSDKWISDIKNAIKKELDLGKIVYFGQAESGPEKEMLEDLDIEVPGLIFSGRIE